jgi:hypothetical protein
VTGCRRNIKRPLTLREEHRLRLFKNRVLRRTYGPKRKKAWECQRTMHNEELHNMYASSNIIRVIRSRRLKWTGNVTRMGEMRNSYKILVGKLEGKRPLERLRRRWGDNIRMDLRECWELWTGFLWLRIGTSGGLL